MSTTKGACHWEVILHAHGLRPQRAGESNLRAAPELWLATGAGDAWAVGTRIPGCARGSPLLPLPTKSCWDRAKDSVAVDPLHDEWTSQDNE